jgi:hypothetical protein
MSLTYEALSKSSKHIEYYKSFRGYRVPLEPEDKIDFEGTQGLVSFYLAQRDPQGRLFWFAKILVERKTICSFTLEKWLPPGSRLFLEAQPAPLDCTPGTQMDYKSTAGKCQYFQGEVGPSGFSGQADLLVRKVIFLDRYTYGSGGKLQQRKQWKTDGSGSVGSYVKRGQWKEESFLAEGFNLSELSVNPSDSTVPG